MNRRILLFGVFLTLFLPLAGCDNGKKAGNSGVKDESLVTKPQILEERVREKWQRAIRGDWGAVYDFMSPGMRKIKSRKGFEAQMRRSALNYTNAQVQKIHCGDGGDSCDVTLKVFFIYHGVITAMQGKSLDSLVHEKWIRQNGAWWFVPE